MYNPVSSILFRVAAKYHMLDKIPIKKGIAFMLRIKPNQFREEYYKDPFSLTLNAGKILSYWKEKITLTTHSVQDQEIALVNNYRYYKAKYS